MTISTAPSSLSPSDELENLLEMEDAPFVIQAYEAVLGRSPDPGGLENYLSQIRAGVSKERVLFELVKSPEGKQKLEGRPESHNSIVEHVKRSESFRNRLCRRLIWESKESSRRQLRIAFNRLYRVEEKLSQQMNLLSELLVSMTDSPPTGRPTSSAANTETFRTPSRTFVDLKRAIAAKRLE